MLPQCHNSWYYRGLVYNHNHAYGVVEQCYYLRFEQDDARQDEPSIALSRAQMKDPASFTGWEFYGPVDGREDHWFMPQDGFPVLIWQSDRTGLREMPDIGGLSPDGIRIELGRAGFSDIEVIYDWHPTIPGGAVMTLCPQDHALPDQRITVGISTGPYVWSTNPGQGSPLLPYEISTPGQLACMGVSADMFDRHFLLTSDIDLSGWVFDRAIVAPDSASESGFQGPAFSGSFSGNNHIISNLLISDSEGHAYLGLFGQSGAQADIHGVDLKEIQILAGEYAEYIGGLVGENLGNVHDCSVRGRIRPGDGSRIIGGLAASNQGWVFRCCSDASIARGARVGGLVGVNAGSISESYSQGAVSEAATAGGLIGHNQGDVTDCYASGSVSVLDDVPCGGLAAWHESGDVNRCYASGPVKGPAHANDLGGLVGVGGQGTTQACYFLSPGPDNAIGTMLSHLEMRQEESFVDWPFVSMDADNEDAYWFMPYSSEPVLKWQPEAKDMQYIPRLAGLSLQQAGLSLQQAGFQLGVVTYDYDPCIPAECTITSSPYYAARRGSPVDVIASQGPYNWQTNHGDGSRLNPYEIGTPGQVLCLGHDPELLDGSFLLMSDLDMKGRICRKALIADNRDLSFSGLFDGNGKIIKNLSISGNDASRYLGLFGRNYGSIFDLGVEDLVIMGGHQVEFVGGLVGENHGTIDRSFASGEILLREDTRGIGGLTGSNGGTLTHCYALMNMSAGARTQYMGGLVGSESGTISNCYAAAQISAGPDARGIGGFIGAYWRGRLIGNSYYLEADYGEHGSDSGGIALSELEMYSPDSFIGWDFVGQLEDGWMDVWTMPARGCYPGLSIFQQDEMAPSGGQGAMEDPYLIHTVRDLVLVSYNPRACYQLRANIDLTGISWDSPLIPWFDGSFDGMGYGIANLNMKTGAYGGMFGRLHSDAHVYKLNLSNAQLQTDTYYTGLLAGFNQGSVACCRVDGTLQGSSGAGGIIGYNHGDIEGCWVNIRMTAGDPQPETYVQSMSPTPNTELGLARHLPGPYRKARYLGGCVGYNRGRIANCEVVGTLIIGELCEHIGGLAGFNYGDSVIQDSQSHTSIFVGAKTDCVGGLIGTNTGTVTGSFASGSVSAGPESDKLGGLVGSNSGSVQWCYAATDVAGDQRVGGLVGHNTDSILDCYSTGPVAGTANVGGLTGLNEASILSCYWDVESSSVQESDGGAGLTTAEMQTALPYLDAGWNLENVWMICEDQDYPRLQWEQVNCSD